MFATHASQPVEYAASRVTFDREPTYKNGFNLVTVFSINYKKMITVSVSVSVCFKLEGYTND